MSPMATPQTIIIKPGTKLLTIPKAGQNSVDLVQSSSMSLPKYAVGLFDSKCTSGPRKRKRLTHLTPEEKIMRRKLKNRVAAQTARDRKKMRLESLEGTINKVQKQARELLRVNIQLLERAEALERDNTELRKRLGLKSSLDDTVSDGRVDIERIKTEFDETMSLELLEQQRMVESSVPDSLLSPDESSDEGDSVRHQQRGQPSGTSSDNKSRDHRLHNLSPATAGRIRIEEEEERASPVPAVFGEHDDNQNPQQQETVPASLIRSSIFQHPADATAAVGNGICAATTSTDLELEMFAWATTSSTLRPDPTTFSDCSIKSEPISEEEETSTALDLTLKRKN